MLEPRAIQEQLPRSTNMPVGNALGVRGDMDIKDAYLDVGGRVMQEQLPSDQFLIFPYRGLYSTDGKQTITPTIDL